MARSRGEATRASLREAETKAGRQATALRRALHELDEAVAELREARRRIGEASVVHGKVAAGGGEG